MGNSSLTSWLRASASFRRSIAASSATALSGGFFETRGDASSFFASSASQGGFLRIDLLGLESVEFIAYVVGRATRLREIADHFANTPTDACVEIGFQTISEGGTGLRIAQITEGAHRIDANMQRI